MAKRSAKKKVRVKKVHAKKPHVKKQTVKGLPDLKPCKPGKYADGLPLQRDPVPRVQAHPAAQSLHVAQEPVRLRQGDASAGRESTRSSFSTEQVRERAAADPRGALPRHLGLPALQQRLHPATTHPLRGRLPAGRSGDRLQVPPSGHADGRRDRRAAADLRRLPHQVQGRGPAAEGSARRHPPAVLAQRASFR